MTEQAEVKKPNIILDASQIDMFSLCEERYHNRYILNKALPGKPKQLDRGTLVHHGMEVYYTALMQGVALKDALPEAVKSIKRLGVEESDLSVDEVGRIVDVVSENVTHWECEDIGFRIKAVEQPFLYLVYEDEFFRLYLSGKIDLLVDLHTLNSEYLNLPVDHKSYDRTYDTNRLSNQFMNYSCATKSNFLMVNKIGFQKTLSADEKHKRVMISYDEFVIERWKNNMAKMARRYLNCVAENSWEMNFTSCDKFNRRCEYFELCESSGEEARLYKLAANYIDIEPWDVTQILQKKEELG